MMVPSDVVVETEFIIALNTDIPPEAASGIFASPSLTPILRQLDKRLYFCWRVYHKL